MAETTPLSSLLALRNNTEQKSFVMVRVPAQQPKMTSRIKCFVWNWLRKYAKVHEGNDVDSTPPSPTIKHLEISEFKFCRPHEDLKYNCLN